MTRILAAVATYKPLLAVLVFYAGWFAVLWFVGREQARPLPPRCRICRRTYRAAEALSPGLCDRCHERVEEARLGLA